MPTDQKPPKTGADKAADNAAAAGAREPGRPLTPAARRALAEAAARRAERDGKPVDHPKEIQGRGGLEPTRYGDWEIKGLTSDF
ncbi:MAG TPA: DUF1674 domain-containing protein [Xanthobacteraceae bacterium]|nr:DUF1674 domain-containing protein [Xanthobacteraceae bacterium]